jgi:hypothetical protein
LVPRWLGGKDRLARYARWLAGNNWLARYAAAMSVLQLAGLALALVGVGEFFVFRYLAPRQESIARRRTLLNANSAFNVLAGLVIILIGG